MRKDQIKRKEPQRNTLTGINLTPIRQALGRSYETSLLFSQVQHLKSMFKIYVNKSKRVYDQGGFKGTIFKTLRVQTKLVDLIKV